MRSITTYRALPFLVVLLVLVGCNDYRVRFLYPKEQGINFFSERPSIALYVSEPEDLRPAVEREGKGKVQTLHFPADDKLDQPATVIVRVALMQDLLQTRVASLVQNPANADFLLSSQLLSMSTRLKRPASAWAIPLAAGVVAGVVGGAGTDVSHGVKVGLVGAFLGTFIPAPAKTEATVEVRLELRDRVTDEVVWTTTCEGTYAKTIRLSLSAREDKKIAEEFLPKALKKANACAVGQLFAYFQDHEVTPAVGR